MPAPYAREKSRSSQIKPGLAELALKPLARGEAPAFRIPNLFKRDYFEWAPARRPTGKPVRPYDPAIRAVRPSEVMPEEGLTVTRAPLFH